MISVTILTIRANCCQVWHLRKMTKQTWLIISFPRRNWDFPDGKLIFHLSSEVGRESPPEQEYLNKSPAFEFRVCIEISGEL